MKEQKFIRASIDAWGAKWEISLTVPGHYPVTDADGRALLEKEVEKRGPGNTTKPGREVWMGLMALGRERIASPGRNLSAMRRTVTSVCLYCGEPITGTTRKRYCSDGHRSNDAQRRKAAQKRHTQAETGRQPLE